MDDYRPGRRDFLKTMTALGAGLYAADAAAGGNMAAAYSPSGKFEIKVTDVEFRRTKAGRQLMARVYQPSGAGPFPTMIDLHGGAWNAKDRHAEEPMDRALAASGVLVVAIDMTLAPEAPYPGVHSGRQLRRALAQTQGGVVERRSVEDRRVRQLQRRSRRRAPRHAAARSALQRDSAA